MIARLFLLFSIMSLAEIYILIKVGSVLGAFMTVTLILVTALVGATLVRTQGLQTALTARSRMAKGEVPAQQMIEGLLLLISGILLITPGFITDSLGLLMLVPSFRSTLALKFLSSVSGSAHFSTGYSADPQDQAPLSGHTTPLDKSKIKGGQTFEGEYEKRD